jgi:hypothetical protein
VTTPEHELVPGIREGKTCAEHGSGCVAMTVYETCTVHGHNCPAVNPVGKLIKHYPVPVRKRSVPAPVRAKAYQNVVDEATTRLEAAVAKAHAAHTPAKATHAALVSATESLAGVVANAEAAHSARQGTNQDTVG